MANQGHLDILRQATQTGYSAPPEVVMEIGDLRAEIATLERGEG
jgi:hypothetical protein